MRFGRRDRRTSHWRAKSRISSFLRSFALFLYVDIHMAIFYEVIKAVFFALTIAIGIFHLRWDVLWISDPLMEQLQKYIMPWYMLFCGIMLGYLVAHVRSGTQETEEWTNAIYIKSFLIGIISWIILSVWYMYV